MVQNMRCLLVVAKCLEVPVEFGQGARDWTFAVEEVGGILVTGEICRLFKLGAALRARYTERVEVG